MSNVTHSYLSRQIFGVLASEAMSSGATTLALSAANTWLAYSYVSPIAQTLNNVRAYISAIAAAPLAADADCELWSSTAAGIPNAVIETVTASDANPAVGWIQYSGFTTALSAGTQYWLIFKNLNALPATNNWTYRFSSAAGLPRGLFGHLSTTLAAATGAKIHTTDAGATWASVIAGGAVMRLGFSGGGFDGTPFENLSQTTAVGQGIYSTRECGTYFTLPTNAKLNVRGAGIIAAAESGTPTGNFRIRLYRDTTLLATSQESWGPTVISATARFIEGTFASVQALNGGDIIRVVGSETTQSDASTNRYNLLEHYVENDADSAALIPMGAKRTYFDGTSWTEDATRVIPVVLVLDTGGEFAAAGGFPVLGGPFT